MKNSFITIIVVALTFLVGVASGKVALQLVKNDNRQLTDRMDILKSGIKSLFLSSKVNEAVDIYLIGVHTKDVCLSGRGTVTFPIYTSTSTGNTLTIETSYSMARKAEVLCQSDDGTYQKLK